MEDQTPINAGEIAHMNADDVREQEVQRGDVLIGDAGSAPSPAVVPEGERWIDVTTVIRFSIDGPADADMVATAVAKDVHPGYVFVVAKDTSFESRCTVVEVAKVGGTELGLQPS